MKEEYTITYIHHSSFCIEFEEVVFVFDYYKGKIPEFENSKTIYFFASHKHYDHFDTCIFDYINKYPNIKFILSYDIKLTDKYLDKMGIPFIVRDNVISINKNVELDVNDVHIKTLGSTDRGVAFIVRYNDKTFYHGGDLNWWYKDYETKEYNNNMEKNYRTEIDKIKDYYFDMAFLPLDARLSERFYLGFDYFMKNTKTKVAAPMHLWDRYITIKELKKLDISKEYRDRVIDVSYEGQIIN